MNTGVRPGYKQTEIGAIPCDWSLETCANISDMITVGIVIKPTQYYVSSGVPAFRSANVKESGLTTNDLVFISPESNKQLSKSQARTGDVLTVRTGYPGTSAVVRQEHSGGNCIDILITRPSKRVVPDYLNYWINSSFGKDQVLKNQGGLAQQHFNVGDMRSLLVALPEQNEQNRIANALSDIDILISSLDKLIVKKRDIQQAAMEQILTGQRRLPGFSGEWKDGELRDVVRSLEAGVSVNSSDDLPEPGLPCVLKTSALSGGNFFPNEAKAIVAADRGRACTNPKRDTILISRMNTPALVGEIAYVEKDYDWLFLPDRLWMTRFMSDDCVNARWLAYLLSSRPYRRLLQDSATGTSGSMKNISKGVLLNLQISYPAIEEQTAIATILSDMDTELTAFEARRDKARQLKQGMMQELLTGRIRLI